MTSGLEKKLMGRFFTPSSIAEFLSKWAIQSGDDVVLEPGSGTGNILVPAVERLQNLEGEKGQVVGVEIDSDLTQRTRSRLEKNEIDPDKYDLKTEDFFKFCIEEHRWKNKSYDVVIGNPPFIRYQDFDEEQRVKAIEILASSGISPTKQMNAWMPFLVGSVQLLRRESGRLAMIIPAALMQVNYAEELRKFLSKNFSRLTIVTFEKLVFDGIEEEVVLLLGETGGKENVGINVIELKDLDDLDSYT